jgi:hypothetical protein
VGLLLSGEVGAWPQLEHRAGAVTLLLCGVPAEEKSKDSWPTAP